MMSKETNLTFVLPCLARRPVGGYKVVYEYANGLVQRGHRVTVVIPARGAREASLRSRMRSLGGYLLHCLDKAYRPDSWFRLDPRVRLRWVPSLAARHLPDASAVVATAWQTAEWVSDYPVSKGRRLYFVQDYEHYENALPGIKQRIEKTFSMRAKFLGISPAVLEMLQNHGVGDIAYAPNGLAFDTFFLETPIEDGRRCTIGFPSRPESFKGTSDAIAALSIVREHMGPDIKVWSFGSARPPDMPDWVEFHVRPSDDELRALFNASSIFVVPSHFEGWGLPGSEAMACGAALVSTDNGGVRAYAAHEESALLSPASQPDSLAADVLRLVVDPALRMRLAAKGYTHIQQFTWARAVDAFENAICEAVAST
jgi:glycosyltransferase involved in cell wall biosynthesis